MRFVFWGTLLALLLVPVLAVAEHAGNRVIQFVILDLCTAQQTVKV